MCSVAFISCAANGRRMNETYPLHNIPYFILPSCLNIIYSIIFHFCNKFNSGLEIDFFCMVTIKNKRITVYIVTICLRILQQEATEQNKKGTVIKQYLKKRKYITILQINTCRPFQDPLALQELQQQALSYLQPKILWSVP